MSDSKTIPPDNLICMNLHAATHHFRVDLAYARDDNLLFGERIYKKDTTLWLHKDLARVVLTAAMTCYQDHHLRFVLYDGLRTVEAQEKMMQTKRAQENPHWMEPPRLLSPPGAGGHPRAMAIDIGLESLDGQLIDMGTPFDFLADSPHVDKNPAHRQYQHPENIMKNRQILDTCMMMAALAENTEITMLPEEWWDYRLPSETYNLYKPLSDQHLREEMRQIKK